jgi:hypothetical protein
MLSVVILIDSAQNATVSSKKNAILLNVLSPGANVIKLFGRNLRIFVMS